MEDQDLAEDRSALQEDGKMLSQMVYRVIKQKIRKGEYDPGDTVPQSMIAEDLDVSRTPVREAILRLDQEGFLNHQPETAATVATPSMQEVLDAIHVRSIIEPEVVRQAAAHIEQDLLEELQQALELMEQHVAGDRSEWSAADDSFHQILHRACPNDLLTKHARQIKARISFLPRGQKTSTERLRECTDEHREVFEAISEGEPDQAGERMKEHIGQLRESIYRRMSHQI